MEYRGDLDGEIATPPVTAPALAAVHALAFLVIGNAVGLLLALLLLLPRLGDAIAPLSYGRWVPVHLNVQLLGWGSLPLVAMLLAWYAPPTGSTPLARWAVHAWSAMVIVGSASWLLGGSSGKAFLDWSGGATIVLVVAMSMLSLALAVDLVLGRRARTRAAMAARTALLAVLVPVPFVMAWASRPDVYPAINPDSGGPTGVSLMGSVLAIVAIFALTPFLLGLVPRRKSVIAIFFIALAVHGAWFLRLDHGDRSHHDPVQIAALASVIAWIPLLVACLRTFDWPPSSHGWLGASLAWGVVLVASGFVAFVPGVLERWKFGHALVAHAHVALAGLVTSWNMAILTTLPGCETLRPALANRRAAGAWHATLSLHLLSLAGLAALEQRVPGGLLPAGRLPDALLGLRVAAGTGQLAVSSWWLRAAWRRA